ncbi:hypothetical protein NX059_007369 [Plenodomus lindquistii]|nr:hypothetical protein NX059_007369 [Plenodomus lindquistii]
MTDKIPDVPDQTFLNATIDMLLNRSQSAINNDLWKTVVDKLKSDQEYMIKDDVIARKDAEIAELKARNTELVKKCLARSETRGTRQYELAVVLKDPKPSLTSMSRFNNMLFCVLDVTLVVSSVMLEVLVRLAQQVEQVASAYNVNPSILDLGYVQTVCVFMLIQKTGIQMYIQVAC